MSHQDEISDLIVRVLRNQATPEEGRILEGWRARSSENERVFMEMRAVWRATGTGGLKVSDPPSVNHLLALQPRQSGWLSRSWAPVALAAGLTALVVAASLWYANWAPVSTHFANAGNESMVVQLPDGSFVELTSGSTMDYHVTSDTRRVRLEGDGLFAVASDTTRRFVINVRGVQVAVLGTRFELSNSSEGTNLVVLEGVVEVSTARQALRVSAGNVAFINPDGAVDVLSVAEPTEHLVTSRALLFVNTPLRYVVREVTSRYSRRVVVADSTLLAVTVTAWFVEQSFEEIVTTLCSIVAARCSVTSEQASISP